MLGLTETWAADQISGKIAGLHPVQPLKRPGSSGREVCGMSGVAVKCIDITQNPDCEGSIPAPY